MAVARIKAAIVTRASSLFPNLQPAGRIPKNMSDNLQNKYLITPAFADKSEGAWGLGAGLVVGFLGVVGR